MMKYKELLNKIKHVFLNSYSYLKAARALPHSGKYAALSIILIIIFTVITFPYDYLIKKTLYDNEGKSFRTITLKSLDFSVIGESSAENIDIVLNNGHELSFKNILINPSLNPYRLFINKRFLADFQFDNFRITSPDAEVIMNLNGNIDIVPDKTGKIPDSGEIKLILEECKIMLKEIPFRVPWVHFLLNLILLVFRMD